MRVEMTNHNEDSYNHIAVKIAEGPGRVIPLENRQAVFQAMDALMTAVEVAEHARGPVEDEASLMAMHIDTSISGYHLGASPQVYVDQAYGSNDEGRARLPADDLSCPSCGTPFEADCDCPDERIMSDDELHRFFFKHRNLRDEDLHAVRLHIEAQAERIDELERLIRGE